MFGKKGWAIFLILSALLPAFKANAEACPVFLPVASAAAYGSVPMACCLPGHCDCSMKDDRRAPDAALLDSASRPSSVSGSAPWPTKITPAKAALGDGMENTNPSRVIPKKKLFVLHSQYRI